MIASLPMYDRPSTAEAYDRLWAGIRDGLIARDIPAPDTLKRSIRYRDTWARDDLLLGQICVMPLQQEFRNAITVIGAADYAIDGCAPGFFKSLMICRSDDGRSALEAFAGGQFACNAKHSFTGYYAPMELFAENGLQVTDPIITGSHDNSLRAVVSGDADFAAIDAHTFDLQHRDMAEARLVKVVAETKSAPGQSFITTKDRDPAPFFTALSDAIAGLSAKDQTILRLRGIIDLPRDAYDTAVPLR
ncbi:phosphate/phosphite/phosphonate ABC transporter substrate-binding protein [Cognatiyoonia sp.]|uniref:phosphate/phosphite/phosphonate ABC transporter substrate-binding protein n=1 Tax=Cognatiyoonia sp. TaxID=2211652 RepID=UPI003F69B3B9